MKASIDLLQGLSFKLQEIADNCADLNTKEELQEFIEVIDQSVFQLLDEQYTQGGLK